MGDLTDACVARVCFLLAVAVAVAAAADARLARALAPLLCCLCVIVCDRLISRDDSTYTPIKFITRPTLTIDDCSGVNDENSAKYAAPPRMDRER